jgi:hypothetical protein
VGTTARQDDNTNFHISAATSNAQHKPAYRQGPPAGTTGTRLGVIDADASQRRWRLLRTHNTHTAEHAGAMSDNHGDRMLKRIIQHQLNRMLSSGIGNEEFVC